MLPHSRRVSRALFDKAFKEGSFFHSPSLSVKISHAHDGPALFSCVVSKKVDKRATKRNLLRRRCYAVCHALQEKVVAGSVVLIFAKKSALALSVHALQSELSELLKRSSSMST